MSASKDKATLRFTIIGALGAMVATTTLLMLFLSYQNATKSITTTSETVMKEVSMRVQEHTTQFLAPVESVVRQLQFLIRSGVIDEDDFGAMERSFWAAMSVNPSFASIDFGNRSGEFIMVKRMPDESLATKSNELLEDGTKRVQWFLRERGAGLLGIKEAKELEDDGYDPRSRPWYQGASSTATIHWTDVYLLASDQRPAVTCAWAIRDELGDISSVISVSVSLSALSEFLGTIQLGKTGSVFVVDEQAQVVGLANLQNAMANKDGNFTLPTLETLGSAPIRALGRTANFKVEALRANAGKTLEVSVGGETFLGTFESLPSTSLQGWLIGAVVPEQDFLGQLQSDAVKSLLVGLLVIVLVLYIALIIARVLTRPLALIEEETKKIQALDLGGETPTSSFGEIADVLSAFDRMKRALRAFKLYVPAKLVGTLIEEEVEPRLGGREEEVTIFFSDIEGFSTFAEKVDPSELAAKLGQYLQALTDEIHASGGTVDKYIGDAIMAFWNAPKQVVDHAEAAVEAAHRCQKVVEALSVEGLPFATRIGIHTAQVFVGNFGAQDRMNYTLAGDGVNLASRLEGANRFYGTKILVSGSTVGQLKARWLLRQVDTISVKGKDQATDIYEVMCRHDETTPLLVDVTQVYERGLTKYRESLFNEAAALFQEVLRIRPEDGPAHVLLSRCTWYQRNPPDGSWQGVHPLSVK